MSRQDKAEAYYHLLEQMGDEYDLEYNPAPGPKWQAEKGILRMRNLNATEMAVMACLIDLAHEEHGFAFPLRQTIQAWTGRSKSAVDRAIARLNQLGFIQSTERRFNYSKSDTTLHVITWQPFFAAFNRVETWRAARRSVTPLEGVVPDNGSGWSPISGQVVPDNGEHISLTYLSKDNLYRSPLATDTLKTSLSSHGEPNQPSELEESHKGIQGRVMTNAEWRRVTGREEASNDK
jgi:hypothetical protein